MIILKNKGLLDLSLLRIMGAHVKETDDPIGYFGTGLKFAIATLLRNNIDFHLMLGGARFDFYAEPTVMRGKMFHICTMVGPHDSIEFAFTTELGRNWDVWQAYRELYSNCLDEGGTVQHDCSCFSVDADSTAFVLPSDIDTGDCVLGDLKKDRLYSDENIEIYDGECQHIYYKGFRGKDLNKPSLYTYNILARCDLSEDRMLAYHFEYDAIIANAVASIEDQSIARRVIEASSEHYERSITFGDWRSKKPSEEFLATYKSCNSPNPSIPGYIKKHVPPAPKSRGEREDDFMFELENLCARYSVELDRDPQANMITLDLNTLE